MIDLQHITGLVLAGGSGRRMGGLDKGLQILRGQSLAEHALRRLRPQVGRLMINANRNLDIYNAMGTAVYSDLQADGSGPLNGFLAGLERCDSPYMVTVPCDSPFFPEDLVARLAQALSQEDTELAVAATFEHAMEPTPGSAQSLRLHPVFCLMKTTLKDSLIQYMQGGLRKVEHWSAQHRRSVVLFDDALTMTNVNSLAELQVLQNQV
jgi:molybdopterin-guanine dinucleotide biosynthesis protein A